MAISIKKQLNLSLLAEYAANNLTKNRIYFKYVYSVAMLLTIKTRKGA